MIRRPPRSTLFPYTPLSLSVEAVRRQALFDIDEAGGREPLPVLRLRVRPPVLVEAQEDQVQQHRPLGPEPVIIEDLAADVESPAGGERRPDVAQCRPCLLRREQPEQRSKARKVDTS